MNKKPADRWFKYLSERLDSSGTYLFDRLRAGTIYDRVHHLKKYSEKLYRKTTLIKDPHAVFLAPWMHDELDFHIVWLVRHPVDFINSMQKQNWSINIDEWASNIELFSDITTDSLLSLKSIGQHSTPNYSHLAIAWRIIQEWEQLNAQTRKNWQTIRYEDLIKKPGQSFERIYSNLGYKLKYSGQNVPQILSGDSTPSNKLVSEDVSKILEIVGHTSANYYGEK